MAEFTRVFETPALLTSRVRLAYAVAVTTDVIQLALGPVGWTGADEICDFIAAVVMWRLLGFHPLLLPTFVLELIPVADLLPTWTGCVALVVALRRRQAAHESPAAGGEIIDV